MSEIYLETAPEKTKRTMKKHRLWLWLPRSVALLIIVCFFFPWYLDGWTGIFTHYKSGVQFVVESIRDTNWSEVQNPLFFQLKVLYSSFPVVGALVFLITSVKKNKKWEAIAYALYAITSSSMLIAILIIHRDLRFRIVPDVPATWVLLGTIPVFVILSLIYLYLMRSRNIRMLQFYIILIQNPIYGFEN